MNKFRQVLLLMTLVAILTGARPARAQQAFLERFSSHNAGMTKVQPSWITPLVAADPRLVQFSRFSFSNQYTSTGTQTTSYGNGKGSGVIVANRYECDFIRPPYVQHNGAAVDGFGDTSTLVKYRITSGNAEHGNYILTAMLSHTFATGSYKNGAATDSFGPTVAAGYAHRRMDVVSTLGGTMPTGKIATQGRSIVWNTLVQAHASRTVWFEVENNASFYFSGPHDGMTQNFVTPAVFYVARSKDWKPTHPFLIFDGGMQIATSAFHTCNHNMISEMRILF